ncbi:MAG TPA: sigma-70 family RNA polymerase sigma factor [Pseudonocardia sp.]|nr:sigma-70 family RNA polymerase sigma factor [Pseudonocardia sp.]
MPCSQVAPATSDHSTDHAVWRRPADVPLARLVDAARAGCPGAWRAVVERFDDGLHAIGRGYGLDAATVDDAVQQTWLSAVTHLAALREPAALSGWLRSILHRECLKAANRAKREIPVVEQHLGEPVSAAHVTLRGAPPQAPEDQAIRRAQIAALRAAVRERLSAREQQLMTLLSDAQEHSYTDIARALDVPIGSIGPTRARCLAKLRPLLAG